MVSWLPLFHDMGMVGFLTIPMVTGLELVSVTPTDFLSRPLLWAELISRHGGTVTAAPNFAYAVLARQLARAEGPLDLSTLRIALNGAEPIDPDAVAAFAAGGARFGLRAESVLAAYGMAETALGVAFAPHRHRAAGRHDRRRAAGVAPARGAGHGRPAAPLPTARSAAAGDRGARGRRRRGGAGRARGRRAAAARGVGDSGLPDRGRAAVRPRTPTAGWTPATRVTWPTAQVVVCGRRKDVIIMGGRNIYPTDIERAAEVAEHVRAGNAVAVRLPAAGGGGRHRESFAVAVESRKAGDADAEQLIRKDVTARVVSAVGVRPAEVVVLGPSTLPKTPSGKLRRAATAELLHARAG